MAKFKVGDKVRGKYSGENYTTYTDWLKKYAPDYLEKWNSSSNRMLRDGAYGTVVAFGTHESGSWGMLYLVLRSDGNLSLIGEAGIEACEPRREFIVIHRSGNVITAEHRVNRDVIKSAKATCAPSDTFDFEVGAKLAFDRLMGREEPKPAPAPEPPKYYTGKVRCIGVKGEAATEGRTEINEQFYARVGKEYKFDGSGCSALGMRAVKSFQEIERELKFGVWIEVKE